MKRVVVFTLAAILLSASNALAQTSLSFGTPRSSLTADPGGASTIGTAYTAPPGGDAALVTWTTSYSVAPASITMLLEASLDNSVWFTLDTSTAVAGELRNIATSARFFRCNVSAVSGATNKTCSFVLKRSNAATSGSSGSSVFTTDVSTTGRYFAAVGTAGAPAYSFTDHPTSGMRSNSGALQFSVSGTARTQISSAGLVQLVGQFQSNDGTALLPAFSFSGEPTLGLWRSAAGQTTHQGAFTTSGFSRTNTDFLLANPGGTIAWSTRAVLLSTANGMLSVTNAGGTTGSQLKVDALPTIASGFGTSPSVTAGSTPFAGSVNVGTGGTAFSGVIAFNGTAFPSTPFCLVSNRDTNVSCKVTATTTQMTITNSSNNPWFVSDVISWICVSAK